MFSLAHYQKKVDRLADLLPWVALIEKGIVLNKDGSFQRTFQFRGPDTESSTESQLVFAIAHLNNVLKRLGAGWAIYIEARRVPYSHYPEAFHFPDPVSLLVDAERSEYFTNQKDTFENQYFLTLQWLPPSHQQSKWVKPLLIRRPQTEERDDQKLLEGFIAQTDRFLDIFKNHVLEIHWLDDTETLTYLHGTISTKAHPISVPEIPMYLDTWLADSPLIGGIEPKLGDQHLRTVSILGFPASTFPSILEHLNALPFGYRWVTRFIPLDKMEAEQEIQRYRQRWFTKRKSVLRMLQEVFTKQESHLLDTSAIEKAKDAEEAAQELAEDYVAYGYYTATITVMDVESQKATEMAREVERVINSLGFTTLLETWNSVEAWLSSIPGQAYANIRKPLLHSLNLAHLIPFSSLWPGENQDDHLKASPLIYLHTASRTPFRLSLHVGDVGHQLVLGPTGTGKSVWLTTMALQFLRYPDAQVFVFDKGGSFMASTCGVGGGYYEPGFDKSRCVFQPLAHIDQESEKVWATDWIVDILTHEKLTVTPEMKTAIWEGLSSLAQMPLSQRTITSLIAFIQQKSIREALTPYSIEGPFGHLLDADHEEESGEHWQCYEMETLMTMPSVVAPVLQYLFHRLEKRFQGQPTLLILDEAWLFLEHTLFMKKIREWLKGLRKQNVSVVFCSQSVDDVLSSSIASDLIESCASRVLLPNDRILEPTIRSSYEKLGLNEKQLQLLAKAVPKQQYYYQSRLGNRLFHLELGPLARIFCAASRPNDRAFIKELIQTHGREHFLGHYLLKNDFGWTWDWIQKNWNEETS